MDTKRLGYFVRVAQDGSLTKASGVLRIAQPALSRQIRMLEEELGLSLFERTARGMQLTEEGDYLLTSVAGPLRDLELAVQNARKFSPKIEGNVTLGMPASIAEILAHSLALRMDAHFPNIKVRIVEGPMGALIDWLGRGVIDFGFLEDASHSERLADRELHSDSLVLVGGPGSNLVPETLVPFKKAALLPLIVPSHHLGIRGVLNDAAARSSTTLNIRFEADSSRLTKDLVADGIGYAILPLHYFKNEFAAGKLRYSAITKPTLTLKTVICVRSNVQDIPGVVSKVRDFISAAAPAMF
jgi:LysR family transcriptional regulator, nitrogen assimilation regulatory protein